MIEYLAAYRIREWPISVKNAHSLQISIKNSRKFLRLLKWVEEMGEVGEKLKCAMVPVVFFKLMRNLTGVCYFFVDNCLWFIHIGVTDEYLNHHLLENVKDSLSLIRYLLRMVIFFFTYHEKANIERQLMNRLRGGEGVIECNQLESSLVNNLLNARAKRRYDAFEMIINILRILMLARSLRLPVFRQISYIFLNICGIVSGTFSLFKLLTGKPC